MCEDAKRMIYEDISFITMITAKNQMPTYSYCMINQWSTFSSAPVSKYVSWAPLTHDQPQNTEMQKQHYASVRRNELSLSTDYALSMYMTVTEMECVYTTIRTDLTTFS